MARNISDEEKKEIVSLAGRKAGNLFEACGFCCSESVLVMLNQGFGVGLAPETAAGMGAGFCEGMGGAGCTCGALSGAIVGLGMVLGPYQKNGVGKKLFRQLTQQMHDRFRERFKATCCRVLTKQVKQDKKAHFANCKMLTIGSAEIVVEMIIEALADLSEINKAFLASRDSKIGGKVKKFFGKV